MKAEKLPSGNKRVRIYVPSEKKYRSFTAPTAKEAKEKANEYLFTHKHLPDEYVTVKAALQRYLDAKDGILSPSTLRTYKNAAKRYFDTIADLPIETIQPETVQVWVNELSKSLAPKSVNNIYHLFSAARAVFCENTLKISLPQKEKFTPYVLTDEDVRRIITATDGTELGTIIKLAIFIPARRSEICALNLQTDLIDDRFIRVDKAVVRDSSNDWVNKTTKTYESSRTVEIPQELIRELRNTKITYNPSMVTDKFHDVVMNLGISCRFHDLRHYGATFLHAQGVPDKYIMERGGWSSVTTLQKIYTHTLPDMTTEATKKVTEKFLNLTSTK